MLWWSNGRCWAKGAAVEEQMARRLEALNSRFYAMQAASFSSTRQSPWQGWHQVAKTLSELALSPGVGGVGVGADAVADPDSSVRLLDLACGNLRFQRFLVQEYPQVTWDYVGADNCPDLMASAAPSGGPAELVALDAVEALVDGTLSQQLTALAPRPFDAAVSFGFAHHVPGFSRRVDLLRSLVAAVRPGGLVAVSLWRFMDDPKLAEKARASTKSALEDLPWLQADCLEAGDFVLGWQDHPGAYRYCHHFSSAEIDRLVDAVPEARLVARFGADGRTGTLNEYLVLRRV